MHRVDKAAQLALKFQRLFTEQPELKLRLISGIRQTLARLGQTEPIEYIRLALQQTGHDEGMRSEITTFEELLPLFSRLGSGKTKAFWTWVVRAGSLQDRGWSAFVNQVLEVVRRGLLADQREMVVKFFRRAGVSHELPHLFNTDMPLRERTLIVTIKSSPAAIRGRGS